MFSAHVLDTEIIHYQAESNGAGFMAEESRGIGTRVISMGGKVFLETGVGNDTGLGKPVHTLADFDQHTIVLDNGGQVVLGHDIGGNVPYRNPHVFVPVHGIVEVKIFNIKGAESGIGCGDDTVDKDFRRGQVSGFRGDVTRKLNAIAANGATDAVLFCFIGLEFSDGTKIGGFTSYGKVGSWDKKNGVGAGRHVGQYTLGEAAEFIGGALTP